MDNQTSKKRSKRVYGTGCLYQRKGFWYVSIRHEGKQLVRAVVEPVTKQRATNKIQAEHWAQEMIYRITHGEMGIPQERIKKSKLILLTGLDEVYCQAFEHQWDSKRKRHHRVVLDRFIKHFPYVRDITHESLGQYAAERKSASIRGSERSPGTINRELSELRRLLNWAIQTDILEKNPLHGFPFLKEDNHRERILTDAELERLLTTLKKKEFADFRPNVIMALYTGMRRGEILNLKWTDIDETKMEIDLLKTKSGKRRRIPIPDIVWKELKKLPRNSEYVFPSPTKPNQPRKKIWDRWTALLKVSKIENFRYHDLRHTCASRLLANGADLAVVKEILGHTTIVTTSRYLNVLQEEKKIALRNLEQNVS